MSLEEQFISVLQGCSEKEFDKYYEIKNDNHCFVFKGVTFVTPIWYTIRDASKLWFWSPDGVNWMEVNTLIVTGGRWIGRIPAACNMCIIESLRKIDTTEAIEYLIRKLEKSVIIEDTNDRPECIICLDKTAIYLAQPCNHLLYCNKCFSNSMLCKLKCNVCNGSATFSRIFF